jgi:hypothetical protein
MFRLQLVAFMLISIASPAYAQDAFEPARRKMMLPLIRSTTDCFTQALLNSPKGVDAYQDGRLKDFLPSLSSNCSRQIGLMAFEHDRLYGPGTGRDFYEGAYLDDLPRAVLARSRQRLDETVAANERAIFLRNEAEAAAETDRKVRQDAALRDRQVAEARAEADRQSSLRRAADERNARVAVAQGAFDLIMGRMADCLDTQVRDLVPSGETAASIASAAVSICNNKADDLLVASQKLKEAEDDRIFSASDKMAFSSEMRSVLIQRATTSAVKAKADAARR